MSRNSVLSVQNDFLFKKGCESMCDENKFTKVFRKFFIVAFSMMAFAFLSAGYLAHAETSSGKCGDNLTWTLDDTGKLTISGTGAMNRYAGSTMWDKSKVKTVEIEAGATSIGESAFAECINLSEVTIPDSVTSIGDVAFARCSNLSDIKLPRSVTSIGTIAFAECKNLKSIVIPNGVTEISYAMFDDCESLSSVTLPEGVTSIGAAAFRRCSNLSAINLPRSVTSIGDFAFANCESLTKITIPDGVTSIGAYTFKSCSLLSEVNIPNSVTNIGKSAFDRCLSLTEINIPNSVTRIDECAFQDCRNLTEITIPDSVTVIDGALVFYNCKRLNLLRLPERFYDNRRFGTPFSTIICYVNADGTTSTKVDKNDVIWLKEESGGTSAWYGLDNSGRQFPIGSKFWVRWLNKDADKAEWDKYYNQLDDKYKRYLDESKDPWIFLTGVTKPNGEEVTKFDPTELWIQLGDDWNEDEINAVFISKGEDEKLQVTYDYETLPDGTVAKVAKVKLSHFSPYAVFEKPNEANASEKGESLITKTADTVMPQTMFVLAGLLVLALAGLWVSLKKQRS